MEKAKGGCSEVSSQGTRIRDNQQNYESPRWIKPDNFYPSYS